LEIDPSGTGPLVGKHQVSLQPSNEHPNEVRKSLIDKYSHPDRSGMVVQVRPSPHENHFQFDLN
jgi:hypothetical protein